VRVSIRWENFTIWSLQFSEYGFFGVAPGTSYKTNPNAMKSIFKDTIFTNVAMTDDGGVWWDGMTDEVPDHLIDWTGKDWTPASENKPAHPNSRFCTPARNCPILDSHWEDPQGVKIEAILLGGRRPEGVPLVYEAFNWQHGVFLGACVKSEATAAAEHTSKCVMHDPFSMRPFFGYNFGGYLKHWLSMSKEHDKLPKIFMVNWFRRSSDGGFLWPGFGENVRVLEWILKRCEVKDGSYAEKTPIGWIPAKGEIRLDGLTVKIDMDALFSTPKDFWLEECQELRNYFISQVGDSLPKEIMQELNDLEARIQAMA
jgi:phosphoenolpyruvate carboxykinase (GTP)